MFEKIKNFLKEVKIEIKKVIFPGKDEVIGSTKVVIVLVIIIAGFLGVIDLLLTEIIRIVVR
jgi:preprotein translocase subunit SecE